MTPTKVYLVTGANRGIGFALVNEIASKNDNVVVFAGVRDISSSAIAGLSAKYPGKVVAIKYISGDIEGNKAMAKEIESKFGRIDTAIHSAGISSYMGTVLETPPNVFLEHVSVNAGGTIVVFQAIASLLKASSDPKFIPFSSGAGSLTAYMAYPMGYTSYGASKAAVNYIARKIHYENTWITCFPLDPGIVKTDMAKLNRELDASGALATAQDAMAIEADAAATLLVDIISNATREKEGGEFVNIGGSRVTW